MYSLLAHLTWFSMSLWQLLHCVQKTNKPLDLAPWTPVSPHYPTVTTEWRLTTPQSLHSSHCNYTLWKSNSVSIGTEKGSSYATCWGEVLGVLTRNEVFREALYHKTLQATNLHSQNKTLEQDFSLAEVSWLCLSAHIETCFPVAADSQLWKGKEGQAMPLFPTGLLGSFSPN